jgi:hypothetical protein
MRHEGRIGENKSERVFWYENLKEGRREEDLDIHWKIILK